MFLDVSKPDEESRREAVLQSPYTIGRAPDNHLVLHGDKSVSKYHARIDITGPRVEVTDLGAANGIFVNGARTPAQQPVQIVSGDEVRIGRHILRLVNPAWTTSAPSAVQGWAVWFRQRFDSPRVRVWLLLSLVLVIGVLIGFILYSLIFTVGDRRARLTTAPFHQTATRATQTLSLTAPTVTPLPRRAAADINVASPTRLPPRIPLRPTKPRPAQSTWAQQQMPDSAAIVPALRPRQWDARLDQLGVTVNEAQVDPGEAYWRLVEAHWWNERESGGRHHIYVNVLGPTGANIVGHPVSVVWADGSYQGRTEDKPGDEFAFNFQMYAAGHAYDVRVDGLPSDVLHGAGMGSIEQRFHGIHTSFLLTFQQTVR